MPDFTPNRFPRRSALAGAIGAPFLVRFADAAEPAGTVDALSGTATAQAGASVRPLAPDASVFVGELGLGGEIRAVSQAERRLAEAAQLGMTVAYVGSRGAPRATGSLKLSAHDNLGALFSSLFRS